MLHFQSNVSFFLVGVSQVIFLQKYLDCVAARVSLSPLHYIARVLKRSEVRGNAAFDVSQHFLKCRATQFIASKFKPCVRKLTEPLRRWHVWLDVLADLSTETVHAVSAFKGLLSRHRLARGAFECCCRSFVFVSFTRSLGRLNLLDFLLCHNALVGGHPGPQEKADEQPLLLLVNTTIDDESPSHAHQE
jgi:hypothetical protein